MKVGTFLTIALVLSSICLGCDDETEKLNIANFVEPTISIEQVAVSCSNVGVVLSGSYKTTNSGNIVTECGFYYYSERDKDNVAKVSAQSVNKSFSRELILKEYGATIYYKAYITNGLYEIVSEEKHFKLLDFKDYVNLSAPIIVSSNGGNVVLNGDYNLAGGVNITERGIIVGTKEQLTIDSIHYQDKTQMSNITVKINDLNIGVNYYFCSYIKEGNVIAYGNTTKFIPHTIPNISTVQVSDIDYYSSYTGGYSIIGNGLDIISKGVVWSEKPNPIVEGSFIKIIDNTDLNDFKCQLTELNPGTTYYVRAFAANSDGIGYGDELSFVTVALEKATINTGDITEITSSSAKVAGAVILDGGTSITERGIVLSTESNPSIDSELKSLSGSGLGEFSCTFSNLSPGTKYYAKAYAINGVGVAYGSEESFTTLTTIPSVSTSDVSNITTSSAMSGGNVTATGGADVTERGIVWGTSVNPTVDDNKKASGSGDGEFSVSLSDLTFATTYYARAYAINSAGISYGSSVEFKTKAIAPNLSTTLVSSITSSSAVSGGTITNDGGSVITSRGVVWSKNHNPTVNLTTKTSDGTGSGIFSSSLINLEPGVTYYVRAYATNSVGTAYGSEETFTTLKTIPSVITLEATDISPYTAKLGGNVTSTGGADVTERGIVWGTSANPTVDDNKKASGSGVGGFTITLSELTIATTFYARAYAVNSVGISYGDVIQFTTGMVIPSLSTASVTHITSNTAVSGGTITSDGGSAITSRGLVWSKNHNPTVNLTTKTSDGTGAGTYSSSITNLEPGVTYYVRAYATNSIGTAYGSEESFTTLATIPSTSTSDVSNITSSSVMLGGNVTATGGADVTERGIVWGTSANPTVDDNKKASGSGDGEFSVTLSDLTFATTYYARAYAINSAGISYGSSVEFKTSCVVPILSTVSATSITSSTAVSGGSITNDGGSAITSRGLVWSKDHNPTVNLTTKTSDGTGAGTYSSSITNLEPGVTYYVRAYATNSIGTAYGSEKSFTTDYVLPTISTATFSSITSSGFTVGGNVTYNGGGTITARGVVWSTSENPTVSLSTKTSDGTGTGAFTSSVSNLSPNTIYYVRAYATNEKGTNYGEQITVRTNSKGGTEDVGNIDFEW